MVGFDGVIRRPCASAEALLAVLLCAAFLSSSSAAADPTVKVMSLPGVQSRLGDFDEMLKRRAVRILVPPGRTLFFLDKGEAYGLMVEFSREFEKRLNQRYAKKPYNIEVVFVPTRRDRLFEALRAGKGDIAAGNLTITPARQQLVDFAKPWGSGVKEVLVTGPSAVKVTTIDDLAGKEITARKSSSYYEHLLELNGKLKASGKSPIKITPADENLEDEDLLEMVGSGLMPWTIIDLHIANLWAKIYPNLIVHKDLSIHDGGEIAWAVRKDSPGLRKIVDEFVVGHDVTTSFGNGLVSQYLHDGRIVKNALAPEHSAKLRDLLVHFKSYGAQYAIDPYILVAQGFQESAFDQTLRMKSGAVGVMQMKPSTAKDDLGIRDIVKRAEDNIHSAAAYLRLIATRYIPEPEVSERDRILMALAAYNGGPGALKRARADAKKKGYDPNVWFGNVEYGSAAVSGQEPVQYVGHIYKYFIAYSLLLAKPEEEAKAR